MEERKNTTAGVVVWTPAPACTSPTSSVICEDVWEDEDGDQAEQEDDFVSQMDENGIIGLSATLENVELRETCRDPDPECNPCWYPTLFTSEKADLSGQKRCIPPEEQSYSLSDHLSDTEFPGEDGQLLSPYDDIMGNLKAWTENEAVKRRKEQGTEHLADSGEHLDVIEEVKRGDKEGKSSDSKRTKNEYTSTSGKLGATYGLNENYIYKRENKNIRSTQCCGLYTPAGASSHHCPASQSATSVTATTFPHLLHFTAEEIDAAPGIDAETFPDMDFTESLQDSHSSLKSSPRCPRKSDREEQKGHQGTAIFPEQVLARTCSLKKGQSPDRKSRTHTVQTRTKAAEVNESRKGLLSYRTPDFSKVEPRVRFPKSGYKPPKSRLSLKKEFLSPGPPIVFKSPADIVKEVLLDAPEECPTPLACNRTPASALSSRVPQDFRCRQQATTLLEQLQEDYNRLLTKYAEAENTIDRLRLEAKVNLYSDLPKPRHSVQSSLSHNASKLMTLDFPQAQRTDIKSTSHPNGHSSPQSLQLGGQLDKILYNQADQLLQQLQTYQDTLKRENLKPIEQMRALSQLAEGLDSLERGYLLARDEHKRLQKHGAKVSHFDPERELEGLIYQCGLHIDELNERVEEMQQEQPTCEALPSPPSHPTLSTFPSEGVDALTHPQTPPVPLLVNHGGAVEVEVSSASEESDEMEAKDEEKPKSFYLKPVSGKHRHVEHDSATIMDNCQRFTELPKTFDHGLKDQGLLSTALRSNMQPGTQEQERKGTGNMEVQKILPQRKVKSDHMDPTPLHASKQQTSSFCPPLHRTSNQSTALPGPLPSSCRRAVGKSHSSSVSSLGEITASEQRNSRLQTGSRKVLSQDGIISPETDSGFVGSESSHLTPAAALSPLHQRAPESVAVRREGRTEKLQTVSPTSPASSSSHSHMDMEPSGASHLILDQPRRSKQGQRRRTFSCSPQRWVSQTEQTRTDSWTSGFGLESDSTHSVPEDGQSNQCNESITSVHSSHPCSSPTVQYHHGNSLSAPGSSQVVNRNDAVVLLQAEVATLKDRLESCLRNKKLLSSLTAVPSAQDKYNPCYTSAPHFSPRDGRQNGVSRGRREKHTDDEVEELRRTTRTRSASAHRQKAQPDILTGSELEPSTLQPQPQMSRFTQTSAAQTDRSHTNAVHNSRTHNRQHSAVSIQVSDTGKEPDRSHQAPLCPQCSSHHRGQSQRSSDGYRDVAHSSHCHHCVFGQSNLYRSSKPECRRDPETSTCASCQPAEPPDTEVRSRFVAAPPALLQCMPMCPPPILLYSSPIYVSPSNSTGTSSGVRGRREVIEKNRYSLSADKQRCLDSSLNRAIRAARHMKHTSRRMAQSLATGLEYQELLTQSCNY